MSVKSSCRTRALLGLFLDHALLGESLRRAPASTSVRVADDPGLDSRSLQLFCCSFEISSMALRIARVLSCEALAAIIPAT
jgi:hypothetical protein